MSIKLIFKQQRKLLFNSIVCLKKTGMSCSILMVFVWGSCQLNKCLQYQARRFPWRISFTFRYTLVMLLYLCLIEVIFLRDLRFMCVLMILLSKSITSISFQTSNRTLLTKRLRKMRVVLQWWCQQSRNQISQGGGHANLKSEVPTYYSAKFSSKLRENDENWAEWGGHF